MSPPKARIEIEQAGRRPTRPILTLVTVDTFAVYLFVSALFLRLTQLYAFLPEGIRNPATLSLQYAFVAIYAAVALVRGHVKFLTISAAFAAFMLLQVANFSRNASVPPNYNSALPFATILIVIVLYETRASLHAFSRYLLAISIAYVVGYCIFAPTVLQMVGPESDLWVPADGVRGARLFLASPLAVFVLMFGIFHLRKRPLVSIVAIVAGAWAMMLSQSRATSAVLVICILSAIIGSMVPAFRKPINFGLGIIFLALAFYGLVGLVVPGFNPYEIFGNDPSGAARALEFADGLHSFSDRYLFGIGIPASYEDAQAYIKPARPFFFSDLGVAGIGMQFGLPAALMFVALCFTLIVRPSFGPGGETPLRLTIFYTTQQIAFLNVFSSTIINGIGAFFAALTIVLWSKMGTHINVSGDVDGGVKGAPGASLAL